MIDHTADIEAFGRLLKIMDELREQCPWDRKQTVDTLRHLTIEEVHELSEAILAHDWDELQGELGDILLHIVFYARIAHEQGRFDVAALIHRLCDKLIRRHPHIYGTVQVDSAEQVIQNWEQIKQQEKATAGQDQPEGRRSALAGVPTGLPSLLKAYRMQEKAAGVGFDWPDAQGTLDKLQEEMAELHEALQAARQLSDDEAKKAANAAVEDEFGDLLFTLVNYARHVGLNPEDALERANRKFKQRFTAMETAAEQDGVWLRDETLDQLEARWQAAKGAKK